VALLDHRRESGSEGVQRGGADLDIELKAKLLKFAYPAGKQ
jgi:hypothetical protein